MIFNIFPWYQNSIVLLCKENDQFKDSAAVPTVCLFWFDAAWSIFGNLILGVGIDTMQYQGKLDLFTGAHWAQKWDWFLVF